MKITLNHTSVQMLLALLRASLHERDIETDYFENASKDDWEQCYKVASRQGVMALAWDGVMKLPKALLPPLTIKIMWASRVEAYEKRYQRYCSTVDELSRFYAGHGIATMQLKGVGFSTLYPVPCHREGGDIDIYTYSADPTRMSHQEANRLADKLMQEQGIEVDVEYYKHSNFFYKGIPIENHKFFLNIKESPLFAHTDQVLHKYMAPSMTVLQTGQILTPSAKFNTLFLAFHAARHYGSGLSLHHLCDWVVLINKCGLHMPVEIKDKRFLRFVDVLTMLCNKYLGTNVPVAVADEMLANELLDEMLNPKYPDDVTNKSSLAVFVYKLQRFYHNHKLANKVFTTSLTRRLLTSIIYHIRKPETILQW